MGEVGLRHRSLVDLQSARSAELERRTAQPDLHHVRRQLAQLGSQSCFHLGIPHRYRQVGAHDPVLVSESRIDIVKQVLTVLFSSISGVQVGVERFNDSEGGTIIQGLIDIDTNRAQALAAVDSLTPEDHTTIAESLYESSLYWL